MIIRVATSEDKKNILHLLDELIAEVNKRSERPLKYHEDDTARSDIFDEELKRDDITIFLVEENGKTVGMAELFTVPILRRGYHQGVIESFVVTEAMRGKGVGTALLKYIFDFCKKNDVKVIKLTSGLELTDAHKFYEKHGGKFTEKLFRFEL